MAAFVHLSLQCFPLARCEFVDCELAREAENASTESRPSLIIWTSEGSSESSYNRKGIGTIIVADKSTVSCSNMFCT